MHLLCHTSCKSSKMCLQRPTSAHTTGYDCSHRTHASHGTQMVRFDPKNSLFQSSVFCEGVPQSVQKNLGV